VSWERCYRCRSLPEIPFCSRHRTTGFFFPSLSQGRRLQGYFRSWPDNCSFLTTRLSSLRADTFPTALPQRIFLFAFFVRRIDSFPRSARRQARALDQPLGSN